MRALIILLVLLNAAMSSAFTWEGELNPDDFDNWQIIGARVYNHLMVSAVAQNPDKQAEIQLIQMLIHIDGTLISYRYFKGGEIYLYELNVEKNRYERGEFTQNERQACITCHRAQIGIRL